MKKLHSSRGETLVEVLASILIASLSVALLFGCVMASSNMDRDAKKLDKEHYEALTAAEVQSGTGTSGTVKIQNPKNSVEKDLGINIYGGAGLYSYKYKKAAGT